MNTDKISKSSVSTICYGHKKEWSSSDEALEFFVSCLLYAEGSEKERYEKIIFELKNGCSLCTDEK